MGYGYKDKKARTPSYRADILHQVDLAEDIAIAYGYENFEALIPNVATIAEEDEFEKFKGKLSILLAGSGLIEASTYHLSNKELQCGKMNVEMPLIELANSISSDYNVLRAWVLPSLMEVLSNNKHHEYPQKIFTIGTIFKKSSETDTNIAEKQRLAVAIASEKADYTEIRQMLDYMFRSIGVAHEIAEAEHRSFIAGRVSRASVNGKKIAYLGEIAPKVLSNWGIEVPVAALELNLMELYEIIKKA